MRPTAGAVRRGGITAIRMIGHIFPVAVSNDAVIDAKSFLLALYGGGIAIGDKTAVGVEHGFLHWPPPVF
jgi:hypothetical protein